jgi:hypothetical protein
MSIAAVSVVATATVAVAGMALQGWLDRSRRRHERDLSLQALRVEASGEFLNALARQHRSVTRLTALRNDPSQEQELLGEFEVHLAAIAETAAALRRLRLVMPGPVRDEADQLLELSQGVQGYYGQEIDVDELVAPRRGDHRGAAHVRGAHRRRRPDHGLGPALPRRGRRLVQERGRPRVAALLDPTPVRRQVPAEVHALGAVGEVDP